MTTTHNSSFHRLTTLVGLCLSLAPLACGGSSGDDTGTATGTGTATTGTGDVVTGSTTEAATDTTAADPTPTSSGTTEDIDVSSSSSSTAGPTTEDPVSSSSSESGSTTVEELAMGFFVSSSGSATGDLGGLDGADARCQQLAEAVGAGGKTWHAYLSVESGPDDQPVHAKDRIGAGPWYNAKLELVAADLTELHSKDGDADLFLDENGEKVPGQWAGSPTPNEHDILTGTNKDGTLAAGKTCEDWTSDDAALLAQVGHSDGLGPNMSDAEMYRSWNSVHESGGCNDTAPKGGAGRIYCFAVD